MPYVTFYSGDPTGIPDGWPKETKLSESFSGSVFKTEQELADICSSLGYLKDAWNSGQVIKKSDNVYIRTVSTSGTLIEEAWYEWYNSNSDNSGPSKKIIYSYVSGNVSDAEEVVFTTNGSQNTKTKYNFYRDSNNSFVQVKN